MTRSAATIAPAHTLRQAAATMGHSVGAAVMPAGCDAAASETGTEYEIRVSPSFADRSGSQRTPRDAPASSRMQRATRNRAVNPNGLEERRKTMSDRHSATSGAERGGG